MQSLVLLKKRFTNSKYFKWTLRLLTVLVILGVVLGIYWYKNKPICEKCNVILVSLDTLSALHLPCYGYERNTAPNLCAYADKNIQFMNSYSQAPKTLDSHFSIFTSLYPHTHKMKTILTGNLDEKYLTLAQVFRGNGYQTIYHGPLNLVYLPLNRGIEKGFSVIEGRDYERNSINSWSQAYSKLINNTKQNKPTFLFFNTRFVHEPFLPGYKQKHLFTDLPEYPNIPLTLEKYVDITNPDFILFVSNLILDKNYYLAKDEHTVSDIKIAKNLKKITNMQDAKKIFSSLSSNAQTYSVVSWRDSQVDKDDPNQIQYLKALYDEQIFNLDKELAGLFKLMDEPNLSKNTILIITADHGEEFMEHGTLYHATNLYRTQTQVPLIIHIPGVGAKKIKEMIQGIDIYPTALSLTGLSPKSPIEGIDLSGLILGKKNAKTNKYLRSEYNGMTAIQDNNWRLYYEDKNKTPKELYNLTDDPGEQKNIITSYPEKMKSILNLIK